jgi:putative aldouronate transport system permease protein
MAVMVVAMLPILVLYPFIQKHFISGLMLGSIKG